MAVIGSSPGPALLFLSVLWAVDHPQPHLLVLSCPSSPLMNISPSAPLQLLPWQSTAFPSCYSPPLPFSLALSSNLILPARQRAAAAAKLLQSCLTLCNPTDSSSPGSPVPGILQARTLEWVAISFSNAWKWKVKVKSLSPVWLLVTPWTAAHQAPPSMGFSRQEYWSGMPLPSPGRV